MRVRWCALAMAVLFALSGVSVAHAVSDVPGGYTDVAGENMVATDRGPTAGTIAGGRATVAIPAGELPCGTDVQVTTADRAEVEAGLAALGYSGHRAVATVGVRVRNADGSKYSDSFDRPITIAVACPYIRRGQFVRRLNSATSADEVPAVVSDGAAKISLMGDADLVVVSPPQATPAAVTAAGNNAKLSTGWEPAAGIALIIVACAGAAAVRRGATIEEPAR